MSITCIYCNKRLVQPTVKYRNKDYHLKCYLENDGSKILTKTVLDDIARRLDCMAEICANALNNKSSLEEHRRKFEEIHTKYADLRAESKKEV